MFGVQGRGLIIIYTCASICLCKYLYIYIYTYIGYIYLYLFILCILCVLALRVCVCAIYVLSCVWCVGVQREWVCKQVISYYLVMTDAKTLGHHCLIPVCLILLLDQVLSFLLHIHHLNVKQIITMEKHTCFHGRRGTTWSTLRTQ